MSWLRAYKKRQFEGDIAAAEDEMQGEPDWIVEQTLRRKREELFQRWREREERLALIRTKEKESEGRSSKRRRVEDASAQRGHRDVDEEAEFLLESPNDDDGVSDDPMSIFSKETRALMESIGLGAPRKQEEESEQDDDIKVSPQRIPVFMAWFSAYTF
jgi:chromosome transmission fidelity protein 1